MYFKTRFKYVRLTFTVILELVLFLGISDFKFARYNNSLALAQVPATNKTATSSWTNAYFPVENFQSYTSAFGYRRHPITGEIQFHNGLDLAAPLGSYVRSWWSGQVVKVAQDNACGIQVKIKSGSWEHVYCHLHGSVENIAGQPTIVDRQGGIQLAQGQNIPTGTRIGRVGMTGRTTGPHLHWVLRHNGSYVDPALIIKEMFKRKA